MKEDFKVFGYAMLALIAIYVLGFLATGGDLAIYRFWAPQFREAQREVFEESQSFVQGKATYLNRLLVQYEGLEDGSHKRAIRLQILEEASTVEDDLPGGLSARINAIR